MADTILPYWMMGLATVLGVCSIAAFIVISKFVGTADRWAEVDERTKNIWYMGLAGSLALFAAAFCYFRIGTNHEQIMYFIFPVTFLALGLAFSALGIALIYKK